MGAKSRMLSSIKRGALGLRVGVINSTLFWRSGGVYKFSVCVNNVNKVVGLVLLPIFVLSF